LRSLVELYLEDKKYRKLMHQIIEFVLEDKWKGLVDNGLAGRRAYKDHKAWSHDIIDYLPGILSYYLRTSIIDIIVIVIIVIIIIVI
jgi:hypothetical protein